MNAPARIPPSATPLGGARQQPVTFYDCLVGARRWIERGLAEAERLNDRQCVTEFQAILDTFDTEASGLNDIIAEANGSGELGERL